MVKKRYISSLTEQEGIVNELPLIKSLRNMLCDETNTNYIRIACNTMEIVSIINSDNVTTSYSEITDIYNASSMSNTQIQEYLETNNDNYNVDISKTIARYIQLVLRPIFIILGTMGNLVTFYVMRSGSLRSVPICFYMSILALADTGEYYLVLKYSITI